jgi:hypothetical protein
VHINGTPGRASLGARSIGELENGRLEGLKLRKLAAIARALEGAGAFPFG